MQIVDWHAFEYFDHLDYHGSYFQEEGAVQLWQYAKQQDMPGT
jgi:hypothetical protein